MTVDEKAKMINDLAKLCVKISKAIREMFNVVKKVIYEIMDIHGDIENRIKRDKRHRQTWITHKDTRKFSQVTNRKPRNLVKRIIR